MGHNNEESEFDREDGQDHDTNDCGHTDAEHEAMLKEAKGRSERLQNNFKKFLAENAEDLMGEEQFAKLKSKVEKRIRKMGMSPSLTTLKIFKEGFEFAMVAQINVSDKVPAIFAAINKLVVDRESKKAPHIDIAKSLPLPPKENGETP